MAGRAFYNRLDEGLKLLDIHLEERSRVDLYTYFGELKKWSRKVNLVAKGATDEELIENHFLDSLTLLPLLSGKNVHLLDVGTGAGFPGLVLKVAMPAISLTMVEPRIKRVSFLRHVARLLRCERVNVAPVRVEDEESLPSDGKYSHITSRAVTEIGPFLEMVQRFGHPDLKVICMKGPKWQLELEKAQDVIHDLHFRQSRVLTSRLPFSGAERALVVFRLDSP